MYFSVVFGFTCPTKIDVRYTSPVLRYASVANVRRMSCVLMLPASFSLRLAVATLNWKMRCPCCSGSACNSLTIRSVKLTVRERCLPFISSLGIKNRFIPRQRGSACQNSRASNSEILSPVLQPRAKSARIGGDKRASICRRTARVMYMLTQLKNCNPLNSSAYAFKTI